MPNQMGPNQLKQQQQMLLHFAFVIQITHTEFTKYAAGKQERYKQQNGKKENLFTTLNENNEKTSNVMCVLKMSSFRCVSFI